MHIKYARSYLDAAGLKRTKSIVCEYNAADSKGLPPALDPDFPAQMGASLILAQKGSLDMLMYSTSDITERNNALFSVDDYSTRRKYAAYNVMCAFGKLYKLGGAVETTGDYRKEVYSLAACGKNEGAVLLVTRNYSGRVEIVLKGAKFDTCSVVKTASGGERGAGQCYRAENIAITGSKIILSAKKNEIYLITLFNK